jgi:nicotinate-nucleotide adenylyltransferase
MSREARVGIFGGSFDPVHLGHLLVAHAAREEMQLERLLFMPASRSPFKRQIPPANDDVRLKMLRLALAGLTWCDVRDDELRRGGMSYTVDTVRRLSASEPGNRFFLLIGEDNLAGLSDWREADLLVTLVDFIMVPRPGVAPAEAPAKARIHRLRGWPIEVSSSEIRRRVRAGLPVDHLVPPPVAEVIRNYRLYLD